MSFSKSLTNLGGSCYEKHPSVSDTVQSEQAVDGIVVEMVHQVEEEDVSNQILRKRCSNATLRQVCSTATLPPTDVEVHSPFLEDHVVLGKRPVHFHVLGGCPCNAAKPPKRFI